MWVLQLTMLATDIFSVRDTKDNESFSTTFSNDSILLLMGITSLGLIPDLPTGISDSKVEDTTTLGMQC